MSTNLHTRQLALLGGNALFNKSLHVGRPNIGDRNKLISRMTKMLDDRWLTNNGPFVQEFEKKLAAYLGVKHCIVVCNATIALEVVVRALGVKGEVIVPSFTFVATAHALQWQEITPVFCDIDRHTHNIDPKKVEELITPRTTAILGVHVWGRPCEIGSLTEIAQRHNLKLIFDAAHAFGCTYKGGMIGNFGNAEVFSFHATKFLNSFEGGAVATNDDDLATKIRLMKNFGFAGYDNVIYIGTNGKMSEISAIMGITSLESIEEFIAVNRKNYECYGRELRGIPGITLLPFDQTEQLNYQYVVLEVDETRAGLTRDMLIQVLHSENVIARRYFYPGCHKMEPYRSYFPHAGLLLPHTEEICNRVIVLPTGTSMDEESIRSVCTILRDAIAQSSDIKRFLSKRA